MSGGRVAGWYLEGHLPGGGGSVRVPIHTLPFVVGRSPQAEFSLPSDEVSWRHAELVDDGTRVLIRDLRSTNGTWVNGVRLTGETELQVEDLVQFASLEFQVVQMVDELRSRTLITQAVGTLTDMDGEGSPRLVRAMLKEGRVSAVFQPIVECVGGRTVAFEALGRSDYPGMPKTAGRLLALAEPLGLEVELSRLLRMRAVEAAGKLRAGALIFLNSHPGEALTDALVTEFDALARLAPAHRLVLEVHEAAITDVRAMRELTERLAAIGVLVAYDDFGAGQARLLELAEAPPHYMKFDRSLVHGLDRAHPRKRQMVGSLVSLVRNAGVVALAEGVETAEEAEVCRSLGFELAQGFYYGTPR